VTTSNPVSQTAVRHSDCHTRTVTLQILYFDITNHRAITTHKLLWYCHYCVTYCQF